MLRIRPRCTLNSEYFTIWITVDLLLEPDIAIRLCTLSRHFRIDVILDLYQSSLSSTSSLDFATALLLLGLQNEASTGALIFLSIWNQLRTTHRIALSRQYDFVYPSPTTATTS
jgi:hypothetical protein